jgi:hypothetical protein
MSNCATEWVGILECWKDCRLGLGTSYLLGVSAFYGHGCHFGGKPGGCVLAVTVICHSPDQQSAWRPRSPVRQSRRRQDI